MADDNDEDRDDIEILGFGPAVSQDGAPVSMQFSIMNNKGNDQDISIMVETGIPGIVEFNDSVHVTAKTSVDMEIVVTPAEEAEGDYEIILIATNGKGTENRGTAVLTVTRQPVGPPDEGNPPSPGPFAIGPLAAVGVVVGCAFALAAIGALLGTDIGRSAFWGLLVLVPLYTRLKRDHLKDHVHRAKLLKFIEASPGTHFSEIRRKLDLHNGVLAYHVKALEKEKLIISKRDGQYKRFYPVNMSVPSKMIEDLTWHQLAILDVVRKRPGIRQKEIADEMEESKQVINYHLRSLLEMGVVIREVDGRESYYTADEKSIFMMSQK